MFRHSWMKCLPLHLASKEIKKEIAHVPGPDVPDIKKKEKQIVRDS